ncbi:unnamed protein product [Aphis gossypii]|uniref:Uncharacterized protein n=1 Tax=Aphis gossypii TaxID=80765 RepID=A0A9P0IVN1_APHGO|nr:unnamed protein product [Aphis gossypii]
MDPNNLPHHVYLHKDHKYKLKLGFHAAPSNPKAFSKAIRDELNSLKFTYCSDLDGLIMGFGKISSNELIPADIRHCISVVVNVDVYIFRPPVGSIIEAIVNQTSDNHVSCLVHNLFNVSIVRPENEPYDQWSGSKIKKDDKIDVRVLSFDLTKKLPHITGEIIKKKNDKCYDSTDIQDSPTKSSSSKNIVSDFTKSFNKNTASPSKSSSSDSESSTEMTNITMPKISADKSIKTSPLSINTTMKHSEKVDLTVNSSKLSSSDSESSTEMINITMPKISADKSIKTSPLSINTIMKHSEKVDLTVNSSKLSSSDSESSDEMINIMTSSVIRDDKPVSKSSITTNTIIQHEDTAESSPELSDSDSEFSSKIKAMLSTFKEEDKSKSTKTASHIRNSINNNKHIESPLFSSTPILNSEHSVNNINLIRNKQKEQLKKHLAKNSTEKQKSLVSDKESNKFDKDSLSQSLNILKNNNNNDSLKVFADSINSNENFVNDNKINQNNSQKSGSVTSDSELEQKNISVNNSFSKKLGKSTKKTKKHKKSNVIVNAILNSINTSKTNVNIPKHLVDSNNECIEDNKEENTVYTQHKHNLESKILDEEILNNCKTSNEQAVKNSLTLSLSTKNIKKKDTPQKKDTDDSKNQIKDKKLQKSLNPALSMISDSDSNCSRDLKLAVKDLSRTSDFNEKIENETSSSDDEIYSKLKQNISKIQINTSHFNEKPKSQSLPNNKMDTSSDESDSSSKLFFKTPKISSKLIKSNTVKNDSAHISEPDNSKKGNDNLLSNEKIIKKDKKRKKVNEKPVHPRLSEKIVNKMDIIKQILDNDSSSDNEEVTTLKNKTKENSRKKPTLNVSKTNKEVSNPFLKVYTTNATNSSANEETVDINLMKSKKKSSGKKDIVPLVNEDSSSDNEEVTTLQNKTSDEKRVNAKNSRKKPTLNVSKTIKDNEVLSKKVSNPFLKVCTTNATNSSANEETVDINLMKSKKKSSGKKDIVPLVNEDSSSDNEEVTTLQNKTSDEKRVNAKNSRKKPTLNVSKTIKDNGVLNKEVSNPFLKVYTTNVTNSSSDEETVDINLMKSKKKSSREKDIIPLVNEEKKKNILIKQLLTSIKRKNKNEKLSVSQTNLNASKSNNKLLKKDKSLLNTKKKKDFLNNLDICIGKPHLDGPNLNIYQKVNLSQLNTQLSSDDDTDDEKDVIKKILKKRKFKKTKNAEILEQTLKSNIPTELNKQNEIKEKLHKKSKSPEILMTAEVKNDDVKKKKKKKDTKDFLLNSIISALDDSLIDHPPSKKKKKDHSLDIEPYDSKDKNSDGNLSEVKIKKKKKSKHKDVNLNDVTVKDKKKKSETLLESVSKNIQANEDNTLVKVTKKKKKSNPVICETQSITTDKQSKINNKQEDKNVRNLKNTVSSKKKTKKLLENQMKSFMETQDTAHLDSLYNLLSSHLNDKS